MKEMLINAYKVLHDEKTAVTGEELFENRLRRHRIDLRSRREYGVSAFALCYGSN